MNRPKRGRAPIKKSTNKKFNTLRKMIWKVKRKKKSSKRTKHKVNVGERNLKLCKKRKRDIESCNHEDKVSERVLVEKALGLGFMVELHL